MHCGEVLHVKMVLLEVEVDGIRQRDTQEDVVVWCQGGYEKLEV